MPPNQDDRLARRADSTFRQVQRGQRGQSATSFIDNATRASPTYPPQHPMPQAVATNDSFERNMWVFYEQELAVGWYKIPKDGRQALESLAKNRRKLADPNLSNVPLYLSEEPGEQPSLYAEVKQCAELCGDALGFLHPAMQRILEKSRALYITHGPIARVLECCASSHYSQATVDSHLNEMFVANIDITTSFREIVDKWGTVLHRVDTTRAALESQRSFLARHREELRDMISSHRKESNILSEKLLDMTVSETLDPILSQHLNRDIGKQTGSRSKSLVDIESLENDKQRCDMEVDHINHRMKTERKIFDDNEKLEKQRQEERREKARSASWWEWLNGSSSATEKQHINEWRKIEEEFREQEGHLIREKNKNEKKALNLQLEIEKGKAHNHHLTKIMDKQNVKLDDLGARIKATKKKQGRKADELQLYENKYNLLEGYDALVPDIISNLDAVASHSKLFISTYRRMYERFRDYQATLDSFATRVRSPPKREPNLQRVREDVTQMRIVYFIVCAAAGASFYIAEIQELEAIRNSFMASTASQRSKEMAVQAPNHWSGNSRAHLANQAFGGYTQNREMYFDEIKTSGVDLRPDVYEIIASSDMTLKSNAQPSSPPPRSRSIRPASTSTSTSETQKKKNKFF
ncbi:unnamed protein product [Periconia digitata]|uniref:Uncharacterized protein n=1 Tax=Periconia digitata TaxID=1303443 RepID=A0A9W4UCY3_9PLEO|nr:unnamed protein product [Periconia digitata]